MKKAGCETIKLSFFLSLWLIFGQPLFAQENKCKQINFYYMFTKLQSASSEASQKNKVINELKSEIRTAKCF